jgi:hypothetical protein
MVTPIAKLFYRGADQGFVRDGAAVTVSVEEIIRLYHRG